MKAKAKALRSATGAKASGVLAGKAPEYVCAGLLAVYILTSLVAMQYNWAFHWDDLILTERNYSEGAAVSTTYRSSGAEWQHWGMAALVLGALATTAAAAGLYRVFSPRAEMPALTGAFMLVGSGFFSMISGLSGVAISQPVRLPLEDQVSFTSLDTLHIVEGLLFPLKTMSEYISLTFSGLAAIAFGIVLAKHGEGSRWLGWLGVMVGLILLLVWLYDSPAQKNAWAAGYLAWLSLLACWLLAGRSGRWRQTNSHPKGDY
jgi:hypothetical protein